MHKPAKPPRKPEPAEQVAERMRRYRDRLRKYRAANRDWLRRRGWAGDAETLITAARRGRVRLTFEIVEKGK